MAWLWSPLVLHRSKGDLAIVLELLSSLLQQKEQFYLVLKDKPGNDPVRLQDFPIVFSTHLGEITV